MSLDNARKALDQAQASVKGITLQFGSPKEAKSFRSCCYNVRVKDRASNTKQYGFDSPQANRSPWDDLLIELEASTLRIFSSTAQLSNIKVKDIDTGEELEL